MKKILMMIAAAGLMAWTGRAGEAKIGETEYDTLQAAVAVAVTNADTDVGIEIVRDITLTNTLQIKSSSYSAKNLAINNEKYTVTFDVAETSAGVTVDAVSVCLGGTGTWQRATGSAPLFDIGSSSTETNQSGIVYVMGGTFVNRGTGAVMNAANGTIAVEAGTFEVTSATAPCLYAQAPGDGAGEYAGLLVVGGGTVKGPANGTAALVCVEDKSKKAGGVYALGTTTLVGSATAASLTSQYFVDEEKEKYNATDGYEFKLQAGSSDTYEIVAKGVATVTIDDTDTPCATWADVATAITGAASATIKLGKDQESDATISFMSGNITLDLDGKKLSPSSGFSSTLVSVSGGGVTLTITDTSEEQTGCIAGAIAVADGGKLVIETGVFDDTISADQADALTIKGGKFLASKNGGTSTFSLASFVADTSMYELGKIGDADYWVVTEKPVTVATITYGGSVTTNCVSAEDMVAVIRAYSRQGMTVTLHQDMVVASCITFSSTATIDLNGKTISTAPTDALFSTYLFGFIVTGGGISLTITDSSEEKTGRIVIDPVTMAATKRRGSIIPAVSLINKGDLIIEAGTFDGMVNIQSGGKGHITGGSFLASENGGTESFSLAGSKDDSVTQTPTLMKIDGSDYWVVGDVTMPEEAVVAKIGTTKYAALQDAVDAAAANSARTVTVEVVKDITLDKPLAIVADSFEMNRIVLANATNTVTFAGDAASAGITVKGAAVEFRGDGTWRRESGTAALVDIGLAGATEALDAGVVLIYGGNFENKGTGHVVNVAFGWLVVRGGTFEGPTDGTASLVGGDVDKALLYIDVDFASAIAFTGSKTSVDAMSGYLAKKKDGNYTNLIDYEYVNDYAFKLKSGSTDTYVIAKMAAVNEPVEAGESAVYDKEDTATKAAETINTNKENLITIPNADTVGELTAAQKKAYADLFIATANGTTVTVDFTEDAKTNTLVKAATEAAKNLDLQTFAKATDDSVQTLAIMDATPGLFYTLLMGTDTPAELPPTNSVQATSTGKVTFSLKKPGDKAFFRIAISAQAIESKTE